MKAPTKFFLHISKHFDEIKQIYSIVWMKCVSGLVGITESTTIRKKFTIFCQRKLNKKKCSFKIMFSHVFPSMQKKKIERCDAFWISENVCTTFFPLNKSKNTKFSAVVNNHCIRLNKAAYCIRVIRHMSEFNLDLQQDTWMLNCVFTASERDSRGSKPSNSMSTLNWIERIAAWKQLCNDFIFENAILHVR